MASKKEKSADSSRRSMSKNSPLNESYDYHSELDNSEKWRKAKDEVEEQWKGLPSNKVLSQVGKSRKLTSKPRKKKQTNRKGLTNKQIKTKRLMNEDYYEDYDETQEKPSPSTTEMLHKVVPYLLQKYRPKRLHLYTNRKVDLDRSESQIGSSVEDALNTGRFAGEPRYNGPLTPRDVIGKISTIPRRPCHGPACHEHHKGLVRFYWRRVVFPRNRTRTRQRDLEENIEDEDYDEGDNRPPTRQRNKSRNRGRRRNRNRGRNRSRGTQQEQSREENNDYFDESNDEEEDQVNSRRNRNRNRTSGRGRNRQINRNRQRVTSRNKYKDYNDENSQVYKDRNDYEEDK